MFDTYATGSNPPERRRTAHFQSLAHVLSTSRYVLRSIKSHYPSLRINYFHMNGRSATYVAEHTAWTMALTHLTSAVEHIACPQNDMAFQACSIRNRYQDPSDASAQAMLSQVSVQSLSYQQILTKRMTSFAPAWASTKCIYETP